MFFRECARLAKQYPDLATVFQRVDSRLREMGAAAVIRPEDLASFLRIDLNQIRTALDLLTQNSVLRRVEMIECVECGMAAPRSDYLRSMDEDDEYRCTSCDRALTDRTVQIITAYEPGDEWPDVSHLTGGSADAVVSESSSSIAKVQVDLQRLIEGKETIEISAAARYLELSLDHVRRLVRKGKLTRAGCGRPVKISTRSLRDYKGW